MSEIRLFECCECHNKFTADTPFNSEVCPLCSGDMLPVDYVPQVDWQARAKQAETERDALRAELAAVTAERDRELQAAYCALRQVKDVLIQVDGIDFTSAITAIDEYTSGRDKYSSVYDELAAVTAERDGLKERTNAAADLLESISAWLWKTNGNPDWSSQFMSVCSLFEPKGGEE